MAFWHVIIGSGSRGEGQSQAVWGKVPSRVQGWGPGDTVPKSRNSITNLKA